MNLAHAVTVVLISNTFFSTRVSADSYLREYFNARLIVTIRRRSKKKKKKIPSRSSSKEITNARNQFRDKITEAASGGRACGGLSRVHVRPSRDPG